MHQHKIFLEFWLFLLLLLFLGRPNIPCRFYLYDLQYWLLLWIAVNKFSRNDCNRCHFHLFAFWFSFFFFLVLFWSIFNFPKWKCIQLKIHSWKGMNELTTIVSIVNGVRVCVCVYGSFLYTSKTTFRWMSMSVSILFHSYSNSMT